MYVSHVLIRVRSLPRALFLLLTAVMLTGCANDIKGSFVLQPGSTARFSSHGSRAMVHLDNRGPGAVSVTIGSSSSPADEVHTLESRSQIIRTRRGELQMIVRTSGDVPATLWYNIHGTENAFAYYDGARITTLSEQVEHIEDITGSPVPDDANVPPKTEK